MNYPPNCQAEHDHATAFTEFETFAVDYYERMIASLRGLDRVALHAVLSVLNGVRRSGRTLWLAGNGGSAAICNHAACDLGKGTWVEGAPPLRCVSLATNTPLMMGIANDLGFEEVFRSQLVHQGRPGDALLLISSSGNSRNLVNACEWANQAHLSTAAFVGFGGGTLNHIAQHVLWVPVDNYGIVEDVHQSLVHVMAQYLRIEAEQPPHVVVAR